MSRHDSTPTGEPRSGRIDRRAFLRTSAAATVGATSVAGCLGGFTGGSGTTEIRAFLWEGYGPIVDKFNEQNDDVNVQVEKATSTNNMFTKAKSAPDRYDVVAPNSGYAQRFRDAGLIAPLAKNQQEMVKQVPNLKNTFDYFRQGTIKDHLTGSDGQWYGIPPRYGLYGIGIDTNEIDKSKIQSSADLWENKDIWMNNVGVNIDPVHSITHAVRALGYTDMLRGDKIDVSGKAWKETKQKWLEFANVARATFESEAQYGRAMKSDSYDVGVGPGRNDIINLIKKGNKNFEFIPPKEGAIAWTEAMLMMKNTKAKAEVKRFMDFFLKPKIGAELATTDLSPSTVKAAKKHLTQRQQDLFYIPASEVEKAIQDKPFTQPQKWKQLMNTFKTKI